MSEKVYLCFDGKCPVVVLVGDLPVYFSRPKTQLERLALKILGWPYGEYEDPQSTGKYRLKGEVSDNKQGDDGE